VHNADDPLALKEIIQDDEDSLEIHADQLSTWLYELKTLIDRHRELMIEY